VQFDFWVALAAASTLVWGAAYSLWMYKRVIFGAVGNANVAGMHDVGRREFWMLVAMALLVLGLGIYPAPVTDMTEASVSKLLEQIAVSKIR